MASPASTSTPRIHGGWDAHQGIRHVTDATIFNAAAFARIGNEIHALICCAGVLRTGPMATMAIEDFDLVLNTNRAALAGAAVAATRSATARTPSRVVLLSSIAALRPKVSSGAYAASKAAVSQLCRVMAAEWAPTGVLVNAIAPGTVDTPMRGHFQLNTSNGLSSPVAPAIGPGRAAWRSSRRCWFRRQIGARYITGTTIPVDGGTQAAFIPPGSV